jgi:hypothetical protein
MVNVPHKMLKVFLDMVTILINMVKVYMDVGKLSLDMIKVFQDMVNVPTIKESLSEHGQHLNSYV